MAFSDRELLARLVQCEAGGEGENGMKAVANVVMNRVHVSDPTPVLLPGKSHGQRSLVGCSPWGR